MRFIAGLFALSVLLSGCVIRDPDRGCGGFGDCGPGHVCDHGSGLCFPISDYSPGCSAPSDCRAGETCTPEHLCRSGSCAVHGCVRGFACAVVEGVFECVAGTPLDAGDHPRGDASERPLDASAAADGSLVSDASAPVDADLDGAGPSSDASDATQP